MGFFCKKRIAGADGIRAADNGPKATQASATMRAFRCKGIAKVNGVVEIEEQPAGSVSKPAQLERVQELALENDDIAIR
jgi:hypothetical protein